MSAQSAFGGVATKGISSHNTICAKGLRDSNAEAVKKTERGNASGTGRALQVDHQTNHYHRKPWWRNKFNHTFLPERRAQCTLSPPA
jgi:hypothetical protein